jgi:hypothetical protein
VKAKPGDTRPDAIIEAILEELLLLDVDITAREVARRHPTLNAASSITRDATRRGIVIAYRQKQQDMRRWAERTQKKSSASLERTLADKDARIADLEAQIETLVASHLAMIRAAGESGGLRAWLRFFEDATTARDELISLGAVPPGDVIKLRERR